MLFTHHVLSLPFKSSPREALTEPVDGGAAHAEVDQLLQQYDELYYLQNGHTPPAMIYDHLQFDDGVIPPDFQFPDDLDPDPELVDPWDFAWDTDPNATAWGAGWGVD